MSTPAHCPKCEGTMIQGFVPDFAHGGRFVTSWHAGAPETSFWLGTKVEKEDGIPVGAFRCDRWGYLEFYASKEFAAS